MTHVQPDSKEENKMWLLVSCFTYWRQVKEKQSAFCTQSAIHSFIEYYTYWRCWWKIRCCMIIILSTQNTEPTCDHWRMKKQMMYEWMGSRTNHLSFHWNTDWKWDLILRPLINMQESENKSFLDTSICLNRTDL